MRRSFFPLVLALCSFPLAARADTLYNFSFTGISGPGSTLSFSIPNPAPLIFYPHTTNIPAGTTTGTVDGVNGYTMDVMLAYGATVTPDIYLTITPAIPDPPPLPPFGQPPGETDVDLYGLSVLELASSTPDPSAGYPLDTFDIVPGTYLLSLPDSTSATVGLTITPEASTVPEPSSLALLGSALLGVITVTRRRTLA